MAWSADLIKDVCLTKSLQKSTISLMDVAPDRLDVVYNFAKKYAAQVKTRLKFEKTLDRKQALKAADFVINTVLAGGHNNYEIQRRVAEEHGYYRGIDSVDHNMVSDYHTIGGYNQLDLFMKIAENMEEICPQAWLLQTANPLLEGCTLLTRKTKLKVIGLCHGHMGYVDIVKMLGLKLKDIKVQSIGFNHCIWLSSFLCKNDDVYPLLDRWIETESNIYWKTWNPNYDDVQMSPAAVDMYKRFHLFPIGDSTRNGGWKYHTNLETKKKWYGPIGGFDSEVGWALYMDDLKNQMDKMLSLYRDPSISATSIFPPTMSGEQHVPIIDALVNDKEGIFQVNIPNKGMIKGIPDDVVVEVPTIVNKKGIQRLQFNELPKRLVLHVIIPRMLRMEWALQAYLEGGEDLILEWLLADQRTKSFNQAKKAIKAILALPFNKNMKKHYS